MADNIIEQLANKLLSLQREKEVLIGKVKAIDIEMHDIGRKIRNVTVGIPVDEVAAVVRTHIAVAVGVKREKQSIAMKNKWAGKTPEEKIAWINKIHDARRKKKQERG